MTTPPQQKSAKNNSSDHSATPRPIFVGISGAVATLMAPPPSISTCEYDHLQFFVDDLKPLAHYKSIEERLNAFADLGSSSVDEGRKAWCAMGEAADPAAFQGHGQDMVEQMLYAFGWRVTAQHTGAETRSLLLSTVDPRGAKFVVTCEQSGDAAKRPRQSRALDHFAKKHLQRFRAYHNGAQGIAVLGFEVAAGELDVVLERYRRLHPKLLVDGAVHSYEDAAGRARVLDVFAYYTGEKTESDADTGTTIRFVERTSSAAGAPSAPALPGMVAVEASFPAGVLPAYCDHWVSNVRSRVGFLETLHETLGFTPKVDFNAGVVAAGEAQIESTVMGNASALATTDPLEALADRGQVFLPTNNALSEVGHVHWYLEELGQGIQHVASRVQSLPQYVERANTYRKITGEGFSFLNIPRTYYGLLEPQLLTRGGVEGELLGECKGGLTESQAADVVRLLAAASLLDPAGAVDLEASDAALTKALQGAPWLGASDPAVLPMVLRVVRRSLYVNLWKLMRDQLTEATYLSIVRNKILIDVQGEDVLMQIFTGLVLQRKPGTEAPFLEFIQRVCAQGPDGADSCKPIRAGCGGFGIRNFLTLFLSIEVRAKPGV